MKHFPILALLFMVLSITASYSQKARFSIEGHTLYKSGIAKLFIWNANNGLVPYDSVSIKNGKFLLHGKIAKPQLFILQFGKESKPLYIGNEHITITQKDTMTNVIVVASKRRKGSVSYNDFKSAYTRSVQEEPILDNIHSASHEPE